MNIFKKDIYNPLINLDYLQVKKFSLTNMLYSTYYISGEDSKLNMINIEFYNTESGECPVAEFILSLDSKMKAKILRTIDLLENNGPHLREPYSKSLGDGIFELRIKQGNDITRVLYFFFIGNKAILTNVFIKKNTKET